MTLLLSFFSFYLTSFVSLSWRRGGPMVIAFDSGSSGLGSSPGRGHCVVFLGKTLYSHSASLYPGVQMGTSKYSIPSRGEQQYSQPLHANETGRLSAGPIGHLSLYKGFAYFISFSPAGLPSRKVAVVDILSKCRFLTIKRGNFREKHHFQLIGKLH